MNLPDQPSDNYPSSAQWDNDSFDDTFKLGEQEIKRTELFTNFHANLLKSPKNDGKEMQAIFGKNRNQVIFDSVVVPVELENHEIQLTRTNMILSQQIQELYRIKKQKQIQLIGAQLKIKSGQQAKNNVQKLVKVKPQLKQLKQTMKPNNWLSSNHEDSKKRQIVLKLTKDQLMKTQEVFGLEIKCLKNKKNSATQRYKQLKQAIKGIDEELIGKRNEKRQKLIDQHVLQESQEIKKLKLSIQKMQRVLAQRFDFQTI